MRLRELSGRDRALCLCYGAFAVIDLLIVCAIAAYYAFLNRALGVLGVIGHFFLDAMANPAAWFVYADLTLMWFVVTVYMVREARRHRIRFVWLYVIAAPASALSVSYPVFMIARQLRIAATRTSSAPPIADREEVSHR